MKNVTVQVQVEDVAADLPLPQIMTTGSAGADLRAALREPIILQRGEFRAVPTGLRLHIPDGYEGQVRPRSGLALKHGIGMVNAPGTIDSDYRGIVQVLLINHGPAPFIINHGDRIAQLIIAPVTHPEYVRVDSLEETQRGSGGFGHTGV